MLSYRHAFHAGNHADVLKHFVLFEVLRYFNRKDKPYWFVDTHAGAGRYDLQGQAAAKNAEYAEGVARLWDRPGLPAPLADFVTLLHRLNQGGVLRRYPGSPSLAAALIRAQDRMRLFEMHPADVQVLGRLFRSTGRQVQVSEQDGFAALIGLLPPPTRRGVILIDPPYEVKTDYRRVEDTLGQALKRFASGSYLVWYPLLRRREAQQLRERLRRLPAPAWLQVELRVRAAAATPAGMFGSGMFVINPPWTLHATLDAVMPALRDCLALGDGADFSLQAQLP
ncbi:MAG: 23S rRNA (adenine(2030)-N(6))-methyltransferase RlmJ [Chromatiaceae bacterium]|nr:23S rRNA (adenine(2030)-N(6))-methyltransferase RlmJ [Chromatiaceae bacterium]